MNAFDQDYNVFQDALKIQEPWYVFHHELDQDAGELHIYLEYRRGALFICPNCGYEHCHVHDIQDQDRTWRHLDFWQYKTILHARMPRIKCIACGKIRTVHIDWARPGGGLSLFFESYVMSLMTEMPVATVARQVGEHDTRLWRVFHHYVDNGMEALDFTNVQRVAFDETSSKRGHQYVTLFVDTDTKRVMFATEGKDSGTLKQFKDFLEDKGIPPEQIEEACCDMSPSFISGIGEHFPEAHVTFDKFHIMKMVNKALDDVRRQEQKEQPILKKTRYLWLKNQGNLTEKQQESMIKLKDMELKTGRAYRLKILLQKLWITNRSIAGLYFDEWCDWAIRSRLQPMVDVAKNLRAHKPGILRWFTSKMTNGLLEGINSLIQAAKRKARGYRTTENLIAMIYATVNKLEFGLLSYRAY